MSILFKGMDVIYQKSFLFSINWLPNDIDWIYYMIYTPHTIVWTSVSYDVNLLFRELNHSMKRTEKEFYCPNEQHQRCGMCIET